MMRETNSLTTAMKRLADLLGWEVESSGRAWRVLDMGPDYEGNHFEGLLHTNRGLFTHMATFAMSETGGLGMTGPELARELGFSARYVWAPKQGVFVAPTPKTATASEEAILSRMFPARTREEYQEWTESLRT